MDSDWIAKTLAEQAISIDTTPTMTIGRAPSGSTSRASERTSDIASSLPSIELLRDDEPFDSGSPNLHVLGRLGQGGMGIVELAHQPLLNRDVAVKRLSEPSPGRAAMLLREARVTGSLEHPNIIPIHTIGHHDEHGPLVVMKRIQGQSWDARLAGDRARLEGDADMLAAHIEILTRVCRAIEFAHSRGVIHRDLKPSNVMLGQFAELYVVDWGLALEPGHPSSARLVGSPAYMAPEMVSGDSSKIDERSDVYLLGATLHEVLTGEHRHAAKTIPGALAEASKSEPHAYGPTVPEELAAICNRACHREPDQRFASVESLRRALQQHLEHWRGAAVLRGAAREHELLRALWREANDDDPRRTEAEVDACYLRVITRYEQALEIWDDLEAARVGRTQAMLEMLDYELKRANVHGAQRIVATLDEIPAEIPTELRARFDQLVDSQHSAAARLSSLEQEVEMHTALPARRGLIASIIVTIVAMNIGFFVADPTMSANSPPERLIALALILLAIAALVVASRWRQLTANLVGRQYIRFVAVICGGILVNRVTGYLLEDASISIVTTDLVLIGATLCVVRLPLPYMIHLGLAVVAAALLMTALPGYARLIFLIATSVIPISMLALDRLHRSSQSSP